MSRPTRSTEIDGPPDRKAVLFCPVCDHRSLVEGDWIVRERTTSIEYRCPDCNELITERVHGSHSDFGPDHSGRLRAAFQSGFCNGEGERARKPE